MIVATLGLVAAVASAADRVAFDHLSIEEGLSQSIVEAIAQDEKGFLWFATEDGLNRFDGYNFTVFRTVGTDPSSISHNEVKALYFDRSGTLWIGLFQGGLNSFDPVSETFRRYHHDESDPTSLAGRTVRCIVQDPQGLIWVGTQGDGLDRLDPATGVFTHFRHQEAVPGSLPHDDVRSLLVDSRNSLWIGTLGGGIARLDPGAEHFTIYRHDPSDPGSLSHDRVRSIYEDSQGVVWVGTYGGGLCRFDRDSGSFACFPHVEGDPTSLSSDLVRAIREDHTGTMWVGTDWGGLNRFDRSTGTFETFRRDLTDPESLRSDRVFSLFEDTSHVLWVGTYGGGLSKLEVGREGFRHERHDPENANSLSHDIVWSILEDEEGILWIGTDGGGLNRLDRRSGDYRHFLHDPHDPDSLAHNTVRAVFKDRDGDLWLGTNGGGLDRLDPRTGRIRHHRHDPHDPGSIADDNLRSIIQDRRGALWVGTFGGGLDRLDPATGRITHHRHDPENPDSLSNDFIRTVLEDQDGTLWIGTHGGGMDHFDPSTGRFTHYRTDPDDPTSLNNGYVFSILRDSRGTLWIGTYGGGISRLDQPTGKFHHVTAADGLASDSVYGMVEDDGGLLWISTNNGLSRYDPSNGRFKNYDVRDGLQSNEFNGGAFFKSSSGELFFGGINGFNSFFPDLIRGNRRIPPIVLTTLRLFNRTIGVGDDENGRRILETSLPYATSIELSHLDDVVSFEFAALHFVAPERNLYSYRLEGLSDEWIRVTADRRMATFTDLAPGDYVLRVIGSNSDGVWNKEGVSLAIHVLPPFWATWWFRLAMLTLLVGLVAAAHRGRTQFVRLSTELKAAHDAQMGILPSAPPVAPGYDIAGVCRPASEVGGDFYDWFWLENDPENLCVAVCDISGKAMPAAMTAVMSDGMLISSAGEGRSIESIVARLNRSLCRKTKPRSFAALCLAALNTTTGELKIVNAGLCEPLLRRGGTVQPLDSPGERFPLGLFPDVSHQPLTVRLEPGDVVLLHSDGLPEAIDRHIIPFGYTRLEQLLQGLDTSQLTAAEICEAVLDGVADHAGSTPQSDDMTVVAIRVISQPGTTPPSA